jgi:hypothetical protein
LGQYGEPSQSTAPIHRVSLERETRRKGEVYIIHIFMFDDNNDNKNKYTIQGPLILRLLTKFSNDFVAAIDGTSYEMSTKEL